MRKRISKQNKQEKATISLKKIFIITIIFLILAGMMSVMATSQKLTSVKILLSSGYEMDVMTTSTKISDILAENHIVVLDDETVTPNIDEELSDNKTITITKGAKQTDSASYMTAEEILESYTQIVEKVVTEEVEIPFETITKDVSNGSYATQNRVVQSGSNGLKKVTYRIRYQSGTEIEKTEISSEIIKEPVDKIVQINKKVTSRSSSTSRTSTVPSTQAQIDGQIYKITAYCSCSKCCGKSNGITASGTKATAGRTVAASSKFAMGTKLNINGHIYTVEDRGGAINGNKIDIYVNSHSEALRWGVKYLPVSVVK